MATKPKPADPFWVSNEAFLRTMFGDPDWENVSVVTLPEVPSPFGWPAHRAGGGTLAKFRPEHNNYFGVSLFSRPVTRRKETFLALRVLALDDVGAKVPMDRVLAALGEPTYRIETSPGSEHWGYRLDPAVADIDRASRLIKRVIVGLCGGKDPGMDGVTRLMRLPVGTNVKKSRWTLPCRLILLDPGRVLDPAAVEQALPMPEDQQAATASTAPSTALANPLPAVPGGSRTPDPVWLGLDKLGLVRSPRTRQAAGGVGWDITCPWLDEHTPSQAVDTGTFYFQGGGFKCWHGHCVDKHPADVRARVEELLRADSGGLMGLDDLDPGRLDAVDPTQVPPSPLPPEPDIVRRFWEETVYHATEDRFLTLRTDTASFNDKAFDTEWIGALRDHLPLNAKDKPLLPSQWYRNADRKQIVDGRTWWPARPRLFTDTEHDRTSRYLNTWRATRRPLRSATMNMTPPTGGGFGEWYRLQRLLFGAGTGTPEHDANLEHWLDYQTMIVAAVGVKPGHNPLFIAPQGTGKEIILRPIIDVLGPDRYREIDQDTLKGGFTDWIMNRLVILPEVHRSTRWNPHGQDEYQRIKAFCDPGKPFLPVNQKYRGIIQAANVFVLVMSSNEDKPLALPPDDRRIWVVRLTGTGWPVARFQALARAFSEPSPWGATNSHAIVEWLIRRYEDKSDAERAAMLDRFTGHAPMTQDKMALIERSRSEVELWIMELLTRTAPDPLALPDVFTAQDIMEKVENAGEMGGQGLARGTRVHGANAVGRMLRRAGCAALNRGQTTPMPDGVARHLWAKPGSAAGAWTEKELIDWLDANRRV